MASRGNYNNRGRSTGRSHATFGEDDYRINDDDSTRILPTSLTGWIVNMLANGQNRWLLEYVEHKAFTKTRENIKMRTGVDIRLLIYACVASYAGKDKIPDMMAKTIHEFKEHVTSSISISDRDSATKMEMLRLISEKNAQKSSSWLNIRGQHEQLLKNGSFQPVTGTGPHFFWHKGNLFFIETPEDDPRSVNDRNRSCTHEYADYDDRCMHCGRDYYQDTEVDPAVIGEMVVRCVGLSNGPVKALLKDVQDLMVNSQNLTVTKTMPGYNNNTPFRETTTRLKRHLTTIDMDPSMLDDIRGDVEDFFDKSSSQFCIDTGRPYRRGYLLFGPPGTGKTSLSVAIASHVNVALVTITLRGMDDRMLEQAFSGLPPSCVVLLEDIDCAGAQVGNRSKKSGIAPNDPGALKLSSPQYQAIMDSALKNVGSSLDAYMARQNAFHRLLLERMGIPEDEIRENLERVESSLRPRGPTTVTPLPEAPKEITLSGLLNVIDGANAAEGRLLIMTTNHTENLDPALLRKGRVDRAFCLGYANKVSAELTFKRLFSRDARKRHTTAAIDRLALAFRNQFPTDSRVTTATLAAYCGIYRGRPLEAIENFPDYLRSGDDHYAYRVDNQGVSDEAPSNTPEPFDRSLLDLSPEDFCLPESAPEDVEVRSDAPKSSGWNPFGWFHAKRQDEQTHNSSGDENTPSDHAPPPEKKTVFSQDVQPSTPEARQAYLSKLLPGVVKTPRDRPTTIAETPDLDFEDDDFRDSPEFSLYDKIPSLVPPHDPTPAPSSEMSSMDVSLLNRMSKSGITSSVKFPEPTLKFVAPRPMEEITTVGGSSSKAGSDESEDSATHDPEHVKSGSIDPDAHDNDDTERGIDGGASEDKFVVVDHADVTPKYYGV